MKKRVAIFLYSLGAGGAERMATALLDAVKDDFELHLVLMNETIFYPIPDGVNVYFLEKSRVGESGIGKLVKLPFLAYKYKNYCKKHSIDISFSLMNRPNYINIIAKIIGNNCKTIISERGTPSHYYKNNIEGKISKILIAKLYPFADVIIANSLGNSLDLKTNFHIDNVTTIYNFIESRECYKKREEKFIFITIGRVDEGKNHALLISSFLAGDFDAELWIIGEGPLRQALEQTADRRIRFIGKQEDVFAYLQRADCFVFGSNNEGFPNVLLEALVCGLPVISTDCKSGPREILAPDTDICYQLKDGVEFAKYGILTPVDDMPRMTEAMSAMIKDEEKREYYAKQAKIRSIDFNKDKILRKYLKVIDE